MYRKFLSNIREFRKFTITKMKMTAQKDLAKEKIMHRMWQTNERNIKDIVKIEQVLQEKQTSFRAEIEEKTAIIERYKAEIKQLEQQSKREITAFMWEICFYHIYFFYFSYFESISNSISKIRQK